MEVCTYEKIAHTRSGCFHDTGFERQHLALGNYVLATDELGTEDETPADEDTEEETPEEPEEETPAPDEETPVPDESDKVNPDTGAEDFVGVAAAAAVLAGVGFVALKRK